MTILEAGTVEELLVDRQTEFGYFLTNRSMDVLLHNNEVNGSIEIGDWIKVFLYHDKQGRLAATMTIPKITKETYGWAEVMGSRKELGVFVNIGIAKDILVSIDELPLFPSLWPKAEDRLYVTLTTDKRGRLLAKLATEDVITDISKKPVEKLFNATLTGTVYKVKKVGTYVITEEGYRCFIHESQRKEEPRLGQQVTGRVIDQKPDGSLNLSLLPFSKDQIDVDAQIIFDYMETRNGAMPFSDKSDPEEIRARFNMSKAAFKRAIGRLMKENKVYQEDGWTYRADRK
jgi:predicted RNA-binding protein (virulence factor B family)